MFNLDNKIIIFLNNFYFYIPLIIVYIQSNKEIINTNHNIYYKKDGRTTAEGDKEIKKDFEILSNKMKPKPKVFKNCVRAFIIGGLICVIGQFILNML